MPRTKKATIETPIDENTSVEKPQSKRTTTKKTTSVNENSLAEKPKSKRTTVKKQVTSLGLIDKKTQALYQLLMDKEKADIEKQQEQNEKNKKEDFGKRQQMNEKNNMILAEKQRQLMKEMKVKKDECLSIFAHGKMVDYIEKYEKSITVPKNIILVQYTRAGHYLFASYIDVIKEKKCKSDIEENYKFYNVLQSVAQSKKEKYDVSISVETLKPIKINPLTVIQNVSLSFVDDSMNMGIFKNNNFNVFPDGKLPEEKIEMLTEKFINKSVGLNEVLESMSQYISKKYGKETIVKVNLFSCRAGNYVYTKKNRKTDITDAEMDDLAREFENMDIKEGLPNPSVMVAKGYEMRKNFKTLDEAEEFKKITLEIQEKYQKELKEYEEKKKEYEEKKKENEEKMKDTKLINEINKLLPIDIQMKVFMVSMENGKINKEKMLETIKKQYPQYYDRVIKIMNKYEVNRIPNPKLDDMYGGAKKNK